MFWSGFLLAKGHGAYYITAKTILFSGDTMSRPNTQSFRSLVASFIIISVCVFFFLLDVFGDIFHLDITAPLISHNTLELITTGVLIISLVSIGWQIKQLMARHRRAENNVSIAAGELVEVIQDRFELWGLSPSESDIALLLIKGLSVQEIADLRETRPGTVKSQASNVYQKAGVKNRSELTAYFVEDLLSGATVGDLAAEISTPPSDQRVDA